MKQSDPRPVGWCARAFKMGAGLLLAALAACGGGGSAPPAEPPVIAMAPYAPRIPSGASLILDTGLATATEVSHEWALVQKPSGSQAGLSEATSARAQLNTDVPGDYLVRVTAKKGNALATKDLAIQAAPLRIQGLDAYNPQSQKRVVSLWLEGQAASENSFFYGLNFKADWLIDGQLAGTSADASWNYEWDTTKTPNGPHSLQASVTFLAPKPGQADLGVRGRAQAQQAVEVLNQDVSLSAKVDRSGQDYFGRLWASSAYGITRTELLVDGRSVGVLKQTNACTSAHLCSYTQYYLFNLQGMVASGPHEAVFLAEDALGHVSRYRVPFVVSNPPQVNELSLQDGALIHGASPVSGRVSTDKPGMALTTTLEIGGKLIFRTAEPVFSVPVDYAGLSVGPQGYTLTVTDAAGEKTTQQGKFYVTSAPALAYTPLRALKGGYLEAVDGPWMLLGAAPALSAGPHVQTLYNVATGTSAVAPSANYTLMTQGRLYKTMLSAELGCVAINCAYTWAPGESVRNLTALDPLGGNQDRSSVRSFQAVGDTAVWVVSDWWADNPQPIRLWQAKTGRFGTVPSGPRVADDVQVGVSTGDLLTVAYSQFDGARTKASAFVWREGMSAPLLLSNPAMHASVLHTDGEGVVWLERMDKTASAAPVLWWRARLGEASLRMSDKRLLNTSLGAGVLAWLEGEGTTQTLKASRLGATPVVISQRTDAQLLTSGSGFVLYAEDGAIYSWEAATGARKLRLDKGINASSLRISQGHLWMTIGDQIYRIPL